MATSQLDNIQTSELFRQLALLLQSGLQTSDSLRVIAEEAIDRPYAKLLERIATLLEEGAPLSEALHTIGGFSHHIIGLIHVGENTGRLEETFQSLSAYYAQKERRNRQFRTAFTYPALLFALMIIIIVVLLTQVMPIFHNVYTSLGSELSPAATALWVIGRGLNAALPYLGIILGLIFVASAMICLITPAKEMVFNWIFRLFGDRGVQRHANNAAFAQALSVAVSCGIHFEEGVEIAGKMLPNIPSAQARCRKCTDLLSQGSELDVALYESHIFSKSSAYLLKLGIRAGKGDQALQNITERMDQEAEDTLNAKLARIEPTIVIITSLITGAILLSVMLPLIDIMNTIG